MQTNGSKIPKHFADICYALFTPLGCVNIPSGIGTAIFSRGIKLNPAATPKKSCNLINIRKERNCDSNLNKLGVGRAEWFRQVKENGSKLHLPILAFAHYSDSPHSILGIRDTFFSDGLN